MGEHGSAIDSKSIRYEAKAVDDPEWIADFLADQSTGVLGLVDDGTPHLVTQLFVYDDEAGTIFFHGARGGRAHDVVAGKDRPEACFTTYSVGRFIPASEPIEFTVEYASVVAYGSVTLVDDAVTKRRVLEAFMSKFAPHLRPGEAYEEMTPESVERTAVYGLDVDTVSAKRGEKPPDYPGAYDLEAVRDESS